MARSSERSLNTPFDETGEGLRACAHEDCHEPGLYRAPAAPGRSDDYLWFCLEHVRDYNQTWNYYRHMSEAEIEAERRRDTVWRRPTWRMGPTSDRFWRAAKTRMHDEFDAPGGAGGRAESARPRSEEERALRVLGLKPPASRADVKSRYKDLAKRLHPDANGGDRAAEERLKEVNRAYATLKALYA